MMATYENIINEFSTESRGTEALGDLINLFGLVSNYADEDGRYYDELATVEIINSTKGETFGQGPNFTIEVPTKIGSGHPPVGNNTFILYDRDAALVHELQHVIIRLLENMTDLDNLQPEELNIAVLAYAYKQALVNATDGGSVVDELVKILNNQEFDKVATASNPEASFENRFNVEREYLTTRILISSAIF